MTEQTKRLLALDWMRGFVMVLMTVDHASDAINAERLFADASFLYDANAPFPMGQFLTRWITHLCAPTFVFLAGASMALSAAKHERSQEPSWAFDRYLFLRGLLLIALEPLWMSWGLSMNPSRFMQVILFQVLFAIGGGFWLLIVVRRLPVAWLLCLALGLGVGNEAIGLWLLPSSAVPGAVPIWLALFSQPGVFFKGFFLVFYPLLPWFSVMLLGWCFGALLVKHSARGRLLLLIGLASWAVFFLVRMVNGYGNEGLLHRGDWLSWLHVSKYPPSLSFLSLELGLMALCLSGFWALSSFPRVVAWLAPLRLLGQTALFYYVLHAHFLMLVVLTLGVRRAYGIGATFLATLLTLLALYPLCRWYHGYKQAHPQGWTRYL
jgi:uncharacterized membrane protein